jgi:DNA-binding transcriptional ArsR family regulator
MSFSRISPEATSVLRMDRQDLASLLVDRVEHFSALFKALGHEGRLAILCHLTSGEKSVTELEGLLGQRQAAVSQQLARLRLEGLVATRRDGKAIYYSLLDPNVLTLLHMLTELCPKGKA